MEKTKFTIFGKYTIINTLAISKLVYNAFILQNPQPEYFKNVSKMIINFIWKKNRKKEKYTDWENLKRRDQDIKVNF